MSWMTPVEMADLWDWTGPMERTGTTEEEVLWTGLDHLVSQKGLVEKEKIRGCQSIRL